MRAKDKFYPVEDAKIGAILFHAYTGSPNDFTFLAKVLQNNHIEVLCPLFKGHGTLDIEDLLAAHPDDWWLQAQEALSYMQARHYKKIYVFGLSLGGIFATRLLTEHQESNLSGGVFNSPVYTSKPIDVSYFFERYVENLYMRHDKSQEFFAKKDEIMSKHKEQTQEIYYFTTSFQLSLQDVKSKFLIVQSQEDEMIDYEDAYLLRDALANAQVQLKLFPDNTHVITTNRNRQAFEKSVLSFIEN